MTAIGARLIDWLAEHPLIQAILRPIYHFQLWTLLALVRLVGVRAVYLRRSKVLHDAVLGKSDYDLTCVLNAQSRGAKWVVRSVRRVFPAIREVWLVDESHLKEHFENAYPDYGSSPYILLGQHSPAEASYGKSQAARTAKLVTFFRMVGHPFFSGKKKPSDWDRKKLLRKAVWLQHALLEGYTEELTYSGLLQDPSISLGDLRRVFQSIATGMVASISEPIQDLSFSVEGSLPPFNDRETRALSGLFDEFIDCCSRIGIDAETFCQAFVFRHRPFRFINSLVLICEDPAALVEVPGYERLLRRFSRRAHALGMGITPKAVLVLSPEEWALYQSADPLAAFYCKQMQFDLIHRQTLTVNAESLRLSAEWLKAEMSDTRTQLAGASVYGPTNYLMDVWLGQYQLYKKALIEGIWDLDFNVAEIAIGPLRDAYLYQTEMDVDAFSYQASWRAARIPRPSVQTDPTFPDALDTGSRPFFGEQRPI